MGHIFLVLRVANGQMLPSISVQTGFTPSQDGILAMRWAMHRRGNTAFLPCLFLNCLVLKIPLGLGEEQGIRLMNPLKCANSWKGKHLFVMKILA